MLCYCAGAEDLRGDRLSRLSEGFESDDGDSKKRDSWKSSGPKRKGSSGVKDLRIGRKQIKEEQKQIIKTVKGSEKKRKSDGKLFNRVFNRSNFSRGRIISFQSFTLKIRCQDIIRPYIKQTEYLKRFWTASDVLRLRRSRKKLLIYQ